MKLQLFLLFTLLPIFVIAQNITNTTTINITKTWSQEPNGYTYPMFIKVPTGTVPQNGFPVCILLHGNGGNGQGSIAQFSNILECHVLIAPTGYQNSWNICAENSDAPDVEMINDLVNMVQGYANVDANRIRILGSSNGAALTNRIFIENTNPGIDIVCAIVSHLNESQYHNNGFYKPSNGTNSADAFCGYDELVNPLTTRKYLSISNTNDPIIPYNGGTSPVGVDFLPAETAAYTIAQNQGYNGNQLTTGTTFGTPVVTEFSYSSGSVVHLKGNAAHTANTTQKDYIKSFFADCQVVSNTEIIKKQSLKTYPNPTNSSIIIERTSTEKTNYIIFNTLGQVLITGQSSSEKIELDLTELSPNIYFLKIDTQTIKIIKE